MSDRDSVQPFKTTTANASNEGNLLLDCVNGSFGHHQATDLVVLG
jgi:hypothetical protein